MEKELSLNNVRDLLYGDTNGEPGIYINCIREKTKYRKSFLKEYSCGYLELEMHGSEHYGAGGRMIGLYNQDSMNDLLKDLYALHSKEIKSGYYMSYCNNVIDLIKKHDPENKGISPIIDAMVKHNMDQMSQNGWSYDWTKKLLSDFVENVKLTWFIQIKKRYKQFKEAEKESLNQLLNLLEEQVNCATQISFATVITWLFLAAILRIRVVELRSYYLHMGEYHGTTSLIMPVTKDDLSVLKGTYVRRGDLLNKIEKKLYAEKAGKKCVYLSGMGGEGKSELARAYVYEQENQGKYSDIFWLTCEDGKKQDLNELMVKQYSVNLKEIKEFTEKTLLIVDNYNTEYFKLMQQLIKETGRAHVIITTRMAFLRELEEYQKIPVISDDREGFAVEVFRANYEAESLWNPPKYLLEEQLEDVKKICRLIGYNTMAVAMIAIELREFETKTIEEFAVQFQRGLQNAIPAYREIVFGQNGEEDERNFLEILRILFHDFLHHPFQMQEKQVLSIMKLIPAYEAKRDYICRLLGDNEHQDAMFMACRKLCYYGWLQSGGVRGNNISLHPLIREVLLIDERDVCINEPEFYQNVLKNWLVMDAGALKENLYLIHKVWSKSGIQEESCALNFAVSSILSKTIAKSLFQDFFPEKDLGFIAFVDSEKGRSFLYYDMESVKENVFYCLERQKVDCRYWKIEQNRERIEQNEIKYVGAVTLLYLICRKEKAALNFPDEIWGCDIKEIPVAFCMKNDAIFSVKLPERLEVISDFAFDSCINIRGEIKLSNRLSIIGKAAFRGWYGTHRSVTIPGTVERIGDFSFEGVHGIRKVIIENGVREIGESAFCRCSVKELHLPENLLEIGKNAFHGCINLCGILKIPKGIQEIKEGSFEGCCSLKGLIFLGNKIDRIGDKAFKGCSDLSGQLKLPESLKEIGDSSFDSCKNIEKVIFPPNIRKIGRSVFEDCYSMKGKLIINSTELTEIPFRAFCNCHSLTGISLPDQITILGSDAFRNCKSITDEWKLPKELEKIVWGAFQNCINLRGSIKFPKNLKEIGPYAFSGCKNLSGDLILHDSIKEIGEFAFEECYGLDGILSLPSELKVIRNGTFYCCEKLTGKLILPSGLEKIGEKAFYNCKELTGYLEMPSSLATICEDSFEGCSKLDFSGLNIGGSEDLPDITITSSGELCVPDGVTEITKENLHVDFSVPLVIIPDSIQSIGFKAFYNRKSLKEIKLSSQLSVIGDIAFMDCNQLKSIGKLPAGLQRIEGNAFFRCTSLFGELNLPDGLEKIGDGAFGECHDLNGELRIPFNISEIRHHTFIRCGIESLILNGNTKIIDKEAFRDCYSLKSIQFMQGLERIEESAFWGCVSLEKLDFPRGLKKIGAYAFTGCECLKRVTFPNSLEKIEKGAFWDCYSLAEEIVIPENVQRIEEKVFFGCNCLQKIVVESKHCIIEGEITENRIAIICGHCGSTAEEYAKKNGYDFKEIL